MSTATLTLPPLDNARMLLWLLEQAGRVALWGQKGPNTFDCSGVVTGMILAGGGPDLRQTHNTDRLWNGLPAIQRPVPLALAFYGGRTPTDVQHVMVCLGDGSVYGASGASERIKTVAEAKLHGACVRRFPSYLYRTDFRGFRALHAPA